MIKYFKLLIILFSITSSVQSFNNTHSIQISGKITYNKQAISSVVVSDGISVVVTDKKGKYKFNSSSDRTFIFYSLPSGYESPIVDGTPVFYKAINKQTNKQQIDFELSASKQSQTKHAFIVAGDPQVIDHDDCELLKIVIADIEKTASSISTLMPVHAISMGDIVFDRLELFDTYKQIIAQTKLPFYQVVGNHDLDYNDRSDELSVKTYSSKFGPVYYSFNKGNIHYVVLKDVFYYGDTYKYMGYIDENQLLWLEKDLATVKSGSTVVLSLHIPTMYGESEKPKNQSLFSNSVLNKKALYKILEPFNTHILAGHSHTQWNTIISDKLYEHTHSAVCAAWWQGEIGTDGTPKGYTVYEVNGDSISWYFKAVGMQKDEQFKLYPKGSDPIHSDYFIANVYNYDTTWRVEWYEDDMLIGQMQRYWGKDPLAASTYIPGANKKFWWLNVTETNHLFKAKIQTPNAVVKVRVTDRFGKVYEKELH
ncbi:MAG: calcineurin-like phosphoesterase family protein [Paludibacter sp.]|nr:calcineurin-like phosphoesterase family protein [Paludibacter sp.]